MIEIKLSKIPRWDEIDNIIKKSKHTPILLKLPKSVYEHPKMQYKLEILKREINIFIEVENSKRGRKRKVDEKIEMNIINLIRSGYSIREVGKKLGLSKSTVWLYAKDAIKELKKEQLKKLIWEYKEYLIQNGKFSPSVKLLFLELESAINSNDLNRAKAILNEIIFNTKD